MRSAQTARHRSRRALPAVTSLPALPAIVRGEVRHHRLHPVSHRVRMVTHLWLVDLTAADPRRFRSRDHFGSGDPRPVRDKLVAFAAEHHLATEPGDRLVMLAAAHTLGHVFNPLSVHWCLAGDGTVRWAVLEVHNTYGGRHAYPLRPDHAGRSEVDKEFYVSPFFTVDGTYRVVLRLAAEQVAVAITLRQRDRTVFTATFTGRPHPARLLTRARAALRTPLATHQTSARIRLHGIWLWLRRLPLTDRTHHGGNL